MDGFGFFALAHRRTVTAKITVVGKVYMHRESLFCRSRPHPHFELRAQTHLQDSTSYSPKVDKSFSQLLSAYLKTVCHLDLFFNHASRVFV
jgi:hypothetical protein